MRTELGRFLVGPEKYKKTKGSVIFKEWLEPAYLSKLWLKKCAAKEIWEDTG
jgi:hypothetical protein